MDEGPRIFLRGYGPKLISPRQRRYARQRRVFCCLVPILLGLGVAVALLIEPARALWERYRLGAPVSRPPASFPLEVSLDAGEYSRYGLVNVTLRHVDAKGRPVRERPLDADVLFNGEPVSTVGGLEDVPLRYDHARQLWVARWPIPWNAEPGEYVFRAIVQVDPKEWQWYTAAQRRQALRDTGTEPEVTPGRAFCIAQEPFTVRGGKPPSVEPGLGVLTLEAGWDLSVRQVPRPDGSVGDWRALFDWCEYIGANALLYRAGVTDGNVERLSLTKPWCQRFIDFVPMLAQEAQRRGIKLGVYMVAFETYGPEDRRPAYEYALDLNDQARPFRKTFVSFYNSDRISHMVDFVKTMEQIPGVDFTGCDYIRTDQDGYEMADEFVRDLSVDVPAGWHGRSQNARMGWVWDKVERHWLTNEDVWERWNWFRARKTAGVIEKILTHARAQKPFWAFTLSWMRGHQHGQDPVMMTDAGLAMDAVMLYQVAGQPQFEAGVVKPWGAYDVRKGSVNMIVGNQVDDFWHQRTRSPPAPQLFHERLRAGTGMMKTDLARGIFIHDAARIISRMPTPGKPELGPYPGTEWALAGAAAISRLRSDWDLYPLVLDVAAPPTVSFGEPFTVIASIQNVTNESLEGVRVTLLKTAGVGSAHWAPVEAAPVPPKEAGRVEFTVRCNAPNAKRENRFMLAAVAEWPEGTGPAEGQDLPRKYVAFRYVKVQ